MRYRHIWGPARRGEGGAGWWLAGLALLALGGWPPAAPAQGNPLEPRVVVGKCTSPAGTLLRREEPGLAWQALGARDDVHSRDLLLALPGVRGSLETAGGVRLTLWGSLPELSPFPVLESAVVLHDSRAFDVDVTLDRGRVVLSNRKKEGAARVWVRLPGTAWELRLPSPGDEVALELLGRRPPGPFEKDPRRARRPTQVLGLHVLKGDLSLRTGKIEFALSAPPGPAYFHWDSEAGATEGPRRRDRVPKWAGTKGEEKLSPALRDQRKQLLDALTRADSVSAALTDFLRSAGRLASAEAAAARGRLAVYSFGAIDDLQGLTEALAHTGSPAVREAAVEALRHWIGRGEGQDLRLFRFLMQRQEYPEAQAETVLQLLHSPFAPDRPETYETLIAYLRHSRLPVRELARWHLYRLAPAGRKIRYDAGAPETERRKAYEAWKKLIPSGKLPPDEAPKEP